MLRMLWLLLLQYDVPGTVGPVPGSPSGAAQLQQLQAPAVAPLTVTELCWAAL